MSVILRKTQVNWDRVKGPIFMLIGPVRGAPDWHLECYRLLEAALGDEFVAYIPRRYHGNHQLSRLQADGVMQFERQTDAERYYIAQAAFGRPTGCVIGWLPLEDSRNPRPKEEGPYAQDTYGEIGELRGRMMHKPGLRFVLGAEEGFPGLDVMRRNFERAHDWGFPIYSSLEETVAAAVRRVL